MSQPLALIESALSIQQVIGQRALVMQLMKDAMTEGQHYGKIPGCGDKPSLLQPGAQLMATTFRLAPSYEITTNEPLSGHREYTVRCLMKHDGILIAEGVGFCSSMESKYRYRNAPTFEDTGEVVPRSYWDQKKADPAGALAKLREAFDGANIAVRKVDEVWKIVKLTGDSKAEHPNPADVFNTVLKMAKKRAYVDATISATACNDLFTQDLEDIRDNLDAIVSAPKMTQAEENAELDRKPPEKCNPVTLTEPPRETTQTASFMPSVPPGMKVSKWYNMICTVTDEATPAGAPYFKVHCSDASHDSAEPKECQMRDRTLAEKVRSLIAAGKTLDLTVYPGQVKDRWMLAEACEHDQIPGL